MDLQEFINPSPQVFDIEDIKRRNGRITTDDDDDLFASILGRKLSKNNYGAEESGNDVAGEIDDDESFDLIDELEIYDLIRNINDPEHPLTLEQLKVAQHSLVTVDQKTRTILIQFTPTITHCSMATLIGLCIRVKLLRSLPKAYKVDIQVTPGTHQSEEAVNRQLNDKERVAAALENSRLLGVVNKCIVNS
jgi:metal-sulfur cluster biosynthetic enzyme